MNPMGSGSGAQQDEGVLGKPELILHPSACCAAAMGHRSDVLSGGSSF